MRQRADKGLFNAIIFDPQNGVFNAVRSVSKSSVMDFIWSISFRDAPLFYLLLYGYSICLTSGGVYEGSVTEPKQFFPTIGTKVKWNNYLDTFVKGVHVDHVRRSGEDWVRRQVR